MGTCDHSINRSPLAILYDYFIGKIFKICQILFHILFVDCVRLNAHVNGLRGTTTKNVPGWNLDNVDRGSVANHNWGSCRDDNSWFGRYGTLWLVVSGVGSINTTLRGCGVAKLDFGECFGYFDVDDSTQVNLNGKEIGRATSGQLSKTIEFNFKDGDILELKQGSGGSTIRFNGFTVISCC